MLFTRHKLHHPLQPSGVDFVNEILLYIFICYTPERNFVGD